MVRYWPIPRHEEQGFCRIPDQMRRWFPACARTRWVKAGVLLQEEFCAKKSGRRKKRTQPASKEALFSNITRLWFKFHSCFRITIPFDDFGDESSFFLARFAEWSHYLVQNLGMARPKMLDLGSWCQADVFRGSRHLAKNWWRNVTSNWTSAMGGGHFSLSLPWGSLQNGHLFSIWIQTLSEKVLNPLNHTPTLPKKVLGSTGVWDHRAQSDVGRW